MILDASRTRRVEYRLLHWNAGTVTIKSADVNVSTLWPPSSR
jgi:hypothetical protein